MGFQLLDPSEQQLFRRLGVFQGTLQIKGRPRPVCDGDLDTIEALVVKSPSCAAAGAQPVHARHDPQYAAERLADSPEAEDVHPAGIEHFLGIAYSAT